MEHWKRIPGWPAYQVSSWGRVRSIDRIDRLGRAHKGVMKKINPTSRGSYLQVTLGGGNTKNRTIEVHNLVLEAFKGPCPAGLVGSHRNGNGHDNKLSNLLYETQIENLARMKVHGTKTGSRDHHLTRQRDALGRFL